MEYNKVFSTRSARLRLSMHAKKITTTELSRKSKIDKYVIAAFLEDRKTPSIDECKAMATVLKVLPSWLACIDNNTPLHVALFHGRKIVSKEEWDPVLEYADYIKDNYEKND